MKFWWGRLRSDAQGSSRRSITRGSGTRWTKDTPQDDHHTDTGREAIRSQAAEASCPPYPSQSNSTGAETTDTQQSPWPITASDQLAMAAADYPKDQGESRARGKPKPRRLDNPQGRHRAIRKADAGRPARHTPARRSGRCQDPGVYRDAAAATGSRTPGRQLPARKNTHRHLQSENRHAMIRNTLAETPGRGTQTPMAKPAANNTRGDAEKDQPTKAPIKRTDELF